MEYKLFDSQSLQPVLNDNGQPIVESGELWRWKAIYENNITIWQFNDNTQRFRRISDIDQSRLRQFVMYSPEFEHSFTLNFDSSRMKLIHLYKRGLLNIPTGNITTNEDGSISEDNYAHYYTFWVFGYEQKLDNGTTLKHLTTLDRFGNSYTMVINSQEQRESDYWASLADIEANKVLRGHLAVQ